MNQKRRERRAGGIDFLPDDYGSIAVRYRDWTSRYDLERRIDTLMDPGVIGNIAGKRVLEVGSGLGELAARATELGARITAVDISEEMLCHSRSARSAARVDPACADARTLPFPDRTFDFVFSSEAIEHIPRSGLAIREMVRVVKSGGIIALSTPNRRWHWSISIAGALGLRRFSGEESWYGWDELEEEFERAGARTLRRAGIHILPFQFAFLRPFSRFVEARVPKLWPYCINQVIWCVKI